MFSKEIQLVSSADQLGRKKVANANVSTYPDGTPMVQHFDFDKMPEGPDTLVLRPTTMESFVTGMFVADALEERGQKVSSLLLPFVPGARQDRLNPAGDFLFTLKSVAKMINERKFDQVVVLDPHSNVASGLIDRCRVYPISELLSQFFVGYDAVIAPDAGAGHRANEAADILGNLRGTPMPVVQAFKNRDVATGKLSGFEVNVEAGKHYLVFDDICDGGGTFVGLGQKILEQKANAGLFVTHGIFSKGTAKLNDIYKVVTTTDSTLFPKHDARELNVVERMLTWMQ